MLLQHLDLAPFTRYCHFSIDGMRSLNPTKLTTATEELRVIFAPQFLGLDLQCGYWGRWKCRENASPRFNSHKFWNRGHTVPRSCGHIPNYPSPAGRHSAWHHHLFQEHQRKRYNQLMTKTFENLNTPGVHTFHTNTTILLRMLWPTFSSCH